MDASSPRLTVADSLQGAGEVGRDLLKVDWSKTSLGDPESWPSSLNTIVRMLVGSRFSMWMGWGPELTFFCNDAYRRDTLGHKYPWALGRPASQVWAEIWPDIGPRIQTVLSTGSATWDESLLLFLERSGYQEETYHTFSYSPLADESGAIAGMLCVVTEDTERVLGERRMATLRDLGAESTAGRDDRTYLQSAARRLEENGRSLPFTLVYLFDESGQSAELAASSGMPPGHPAGPAAIEASDPEAVWPLGAALEGRVTTLEDLDQRFPGLPTGAWEEPPHTAVVLPLHQPVQRARPYGFLVVGANRYRPLDDSYEAFLRLLAAQLASGVASARAYEAERRRAEQLTELDRAKTAFFTNVSHELRTPLTLLLGPAEDALADDAEAVPDRERHRMEIIARNASRLLKLVNTLLDFSRLESGRTQASFEPVDLGQYTAELASMFETAMARAGLSLEIDCPPLPEPVYVDREMWAKIVLNLISNALKFTLTGGITVRLEMVEGAARLSVIDTGIGVPESEQPRLFERFHRVHGARGRTHEGSGIGLALVAELAEVHGGRPGVSSQPGIGSTFTVDIPLGTDHLRADQLAPAPQSVSVEREVAGFLAEADRWLGPGLEGEAGRSELPGQEDQRPRILVVDDNLDMRDYVATLLADDYSVQTAPDGEAALKLATAEPPDLVLTDVMMPRLDGFGLLAALQANPDTLHIPVVMLSARAGEEGVIEGLEAGADDYLIKPFSARELLARVRANLELDRARRTRDELEHSHRMQDQAERLAEVGSWELDVATGSIQASDQWLRMTGLTRAELGALTFNDSVARVVATEDRDFVRQTIREAMVSGESFDYVRRSHDPSGVPRYIRVRGEVVPDEAGVPATIRGFIQDVTQRRLAEEAIAASAAASEAAEREHQIADALQRSLLPPDQFDSDHLEVATYYQAGVAGTQVGGDWYEAIELGAGRTALVIGDVAGRGIRAASVMGQLRAAVRAYAQLDLPPAEILELLDAMVCQINPGQLATCIYGVYDPVWREFRYANAGHLPPLIASPGQPVERLPIATSPPLGVGAGQYEERRVELPTEALITLYTDGLVERRGRDLDDGIDQLAEHVQSGQVPVSEMPAMLIQALAPEGTEDDIAILVAGISSQSAQQTATLDVPALHEAVPEARRFAVTTFRGWSLPDELVQDGALIATELVTNAVLHGAPPIRLRLRRTARELAIEVDDGALAMPRKLRAGPDDLHGRGLDIVAQLSHRWAARAEGYGKTVWSTLRIREPASTLAGQVPSAETSA
ncbi:MAG TPA: SpoIIE family protein phosphatase [Solirubrobacteraceae bacterium]|jgi:PAS domain S-box-containing protein|nr:SpoIIE family protein phosphatase [Solirubrobacteraceae bacterium]